jgi:haloalkane dehalogenase
LFAPGSPVEGASGSPQSTENLAQLRLPFDNVIGVYPHWSVPNLPFQVPPGLFPFEHRFMEFDGNCIHYIDEGTGQTLLLLHGNPSWCFLYRKIVAGLKPSFRCVALDFPGYGMSDAPAGYGYTPQEHAAMLEQFVDRLNLQQFTIMMQDWGGPIGLGFAERRPELVHCLIIGNTFARPLDGERRIQIFSWIMGGPIGRMLTSAFNFVPRVFFARGFAQRPSSAVLAMYFAPWQNRERRVAAVIAPRQLIASSRYLRFQRFIAAHQNGLRPARLIFLESLVEDSALRIGEHKITFLNTGGKSLGRRPN